MGAKTRGNYEAFAAAKQELMAAFEKAIVTTLEKMGEDAKGVSWFSSAADEYSKGYKKAA